MKKIYSVILLFTFLVGTLQPIIPMIEYQLYEGNIVELLNSAENKSQAPCNDIYDLVHSNNQDCQDSKDQQLLDTDFYPLALEITAAPNLYVFLIGEKLHLPIIDNVVSPTILPNPPPPWLS